MFSLNITLRLSSDVVERCFVSNSLLQKETMVSEISNDTLFISSSAGIILEHKIT